VWTEASGGCHVVLHAETVRRWAGATAFISQVEETWVRGFSYITAAHPRLISDSPPWDHHDCRLLQAIKLSRQMKRPSALVGGPSARALTIASVLTQGSCALCDTTLRQWLSRGANPPQLEFALGDIGHQVADEPLGVQLTDCRCCLSRVLLDREPLSSVLCHQRMC